jgi:hypothetical protein
MLELVTDPLGAYPVYSTRIGDEYWISPNPWILQRIRPSVSENLSSLASLIGGGWILSGDPIWSEVNRLAPGTIHRFTPGSHKSEPFFSLAANSEASEFDPKYSAAILTESIRALADWPNRPNALGLTAGRDSRVIFAAALVSGINCEIATGGAETDPDVICARELCKLTGQSHMMLGPHPGGSALEQPLLGIGSLQYTTGSTACLADGVSFALGANPRSEELTLWHTGQGGEIARGYYDKYFRPWHRAALAKPLVVNALFTSFTSSRTGRPSVLSRLGEQLVRKELECWLYRKLAAGIKLRDIPKYFYLEKRMGCWAAAAHSHVEYTRDTTSPLWSWKLLDQMLALSRREQRADTFHYEVIKELMPSLLSIPFNDGVDWSKGQARSQMQTIRYRKIAGRVIGEGKRRLAKFRNPRKTATRGEPPVQQEPAPQISHPAPSDSFESLQEEVIRALSEIKDKQLQLLIDKGRALDLMKPGACAGDPMRTSYVYQLAQVALRKNVADGYKPDRTKVLA